MLLLCHRARVWQAFAMQPRDLHRPQKPTSPLISCLKSSCLILVILGLVYVTLRAQPTEGPNIVYEPTPALHPVQVPSVPQVEVPSVPSAEPAAAQPPRPRHGLREHESDMPFAVLNRERKQNAAQHGSAFLVYEPTAAERPGGDMDATGSLDAAVAASAAQKEVMLLCVGGAGSMRTGMNLVFNFRAMGCRAEPPCRASLFAVLPPSSLSCCTPLPYCTRHLPSAVCTTCSSSPTSGRRAKGCGPRCRRRGVRNAP